MTGSPLRLGIIGCGRLAERGYLPALAGLDLFDVVAVADPVESRRARVAAAAGGRVSSHGDAGDLLAAAVVDGLLVASPVARHLADATLAAGAGVVALIEKPPAPDAPTAAALCALTPSPHLGFNRRFDPGALVARTAIPPDGDVELELSVHYRRPTWAAHAVADDALLDLGPHLVDWARWISGREVTSVAAPNVTHERATLDLVLEGGRAHVEVATDRPHEERVVVRAGGRLVADHRIGGAVAGLRARLPFLRSPNRLVRTLRGELVAYAHALRTGDPGPLGTPADGLAVMAVLDTARESAARGGALLPVPTRHEVTA